VIQKALLATHPITSQFGEKPIEAIVRRVLQDERVSGTGEATASGFVKQGEEAPLLGEEINIDEAMGVLGDVGFDAVVGALDMFRKNVR